MNAVSLRTLAITSAAALSFVAAGCSLQSGNGTIPAPKKSTDVSAAAQQLKSDPTVPASIRANGGMIRMRPMNSGATPTKGNK